MQAKDITTDQFLAAMQRDMVERDMVVLGANIHTLSEREDWPEAVVRAKARKLIKQNVIHGCACGCRGDLVAV